MGDTTKTILKINRNNTLTDIFTVDTNSQREIGELNSLYENLSPDINSLLRMLRSETTKVVLCPENGEWRCAAIFSPEVNSSDEVAIFFPWIISNKCQQSIIAGARGVAKSWEVAEAYQNTLAVFKKFINPKLN